jgi:MYXO-CTERM domain-containing protein
VLRIRRSSRCGLQNVLLSRIRERESQFQWTVHQDKTPAAERTAVSMLSGGLVFGLVLLAALLLWRRRAAATRK